MDRRVSGLLHQAAGTAVRGREFSKKVPQRPVTGFFAVILAAGLLFPLGNSISGSEPLPILDGRFDDWSEEDVVARDAKGDHAGAFDLGHVAFKTDDSFLYLHFNVGKILNLQNGPKSEGTLGLTLDLPDQRQLEIDFRQRRASFSDSPNQRVPWTKLDFSCLPTYASDAVELRVDLQAIGVKKNEPVLVNFRGSDTLDAPFEVRLREGAPQNARALSRHAPNDFRVASFNTLRGGLSDPQRKAAFQRLIEAVNAEVYCFQEENEEANFRKSASRLDHIHHTHWSNGCGIASSSPLTPLPLNLSRGVAAVCHLQDGFDVIIVNVHFRCCGYAGSREDETRIKQSGEVVERLRQLQAGQYGESWKKTPIIVTGDYNLVGTRKPLSILESLGLKPRSLVGQIDNAAVTWRGPPKESFWPGRLDIMVYSDELTPKNGYILDTARMKPSMLTEFGLLSGDSLASDHLMLVGDFEFAGQ